MREMKISKSLLDEFKMQIITNNARLNLLKEGFKFNNGWCIYRDTQHYALPIIKSDYIIENLQTCTGPQLLINGDIIYKELSDLYDKLYDLRQAVECAKKELDREILKQITEITGK